MAQASVIVSGSSISYFKWDGSEVYGVTNMNFDKSHEEIDTTNLSSPDYESVMFPYSKKTFTVELQWDLQQEDLTTGVKKAVEIAWNGKKYIGSASLSQLSNAGQFKDVFKATYNGSFSGVVTAQTASAYYN